MSTLHEERTVEKYITDVGRRLIDDLNYIEEHLFVDADNLQYAKIILDDLLAIELRMIQARLTLKHICHTSTNKAGII